MYTLLRTNSFEAQHVSKTLENETNWIFDKDDDDYVCTPKQSYGRLSYIGLVFRFN